MKILITGAAGFIGFNLVNFLLNKSNHKITGIDN
jgi:nucleoside-diphosphate-sugar epimerase